ncbi:MAG TPA: D-glycero-beta-D-manno-heptose 1-phosphate adenylyltransferase [Bacteroidales bacterium]|nr:D-glycero-beta-D-manno-heptose 1-phosphate adenylyltransferase [Bacteroidales bacterium]
MKKLVFLSSKILDREQLRRACALWNFKEMKVVFTNGCFDILHLGHIEYLAKAANLGDVLVIGMNSDHSVHRIKGDNRPINDEHSRSMVLAALGFVTAVVLFDEETPYELIKTIQPDVLVKGRDYKIKEIVGHDIVLAKGGKVKTIELTPGYSTTGIEQKILNLHK